MTLHERLVDSVEHAVWEQLNKRRWFGKHVEDDEMESLGADLRIAIATAIEVRVEADDEQGTNLRYIVDVPRPKPEPPHLIPHFPGDTGGIGGAGFDWNHS